MVQVWSLTQFCPVIFYNTIKVCCSCFISVLGSARSAENLPFMRELKAKTRELLEGAKEGSLIDPPCISEIFFSKSKRNKIESGQT